MITRSYKLKLYPNKGKEEILRYTMWWYRAFVLQYIKQYYENGDEWTSTSGMGSLPNQAQSHARDVIKAGRAAERKTGIKFNLPKNFPMMCQASIKPSLLSNTSFPYWIKPVLGPYIPLKTHKALKAALRKGGVIANSCEVHTTFVIVYVNFPLVKRPLHSKGYIGCDVGVNAGVACSDGYIGKSLRPIMKRTRDKRAEQQRQKHRKTSARSSVKQFLDREAKRVVTLANRESLTLVLESPKALSNLKPTGSIGGWTRRHFGERVRQIAEIEGVAVIDVWPAYSSITCLRCNYQHKNNRRGINFCCTKCGFRKHADVLAAVNLTRRARGVFSKGDTIRPRSGELLSSSS